MMMPICAKVDVPVTSIFATLPKASSVWNGNPAARGTGLNGRIKPLLIGRALDCGFTRIEFCIDQRNVRSQKAVEKLGAVREGVLRKQRITWTGHVRDTVIYSILADEWRGRV